MSFVGAEKISVMMSGSEPQAAPDGHALLVSFQHQGCKCMTESLHYKKRIKQKSVITCSWHDI